MQQADLFLLFTAPLDAAQIAYMVSGSVASMVYGEPRLTNDVDIIVALATPRAGDIEKLFPLSDFYCPPAEVIAVETRRPLRGHFNIIHHETGHKADIYIAGSDPLQAWGLRHRRAVEVISGTSLWIAPPEYVILHKLEYYREGRSEKHVLDIRGMLDVSGDALDHEFLLEQLERMSLLREWQFVSDSQLQPVAPPLHRRWASVFAALRRGKPRSPSDGSTQNARRGKFTTESRTHG